MTRTNEKLAAYSGGHKTYQLGDGPLSTVADQLAAQYRAAEEQRFADHQRRLEQGDPRLAESIRRRSAEARRAELENHEAPLVLRFEAAQMAGQAAQQTPHDPGMQRLARQLEGLWREEPEGTLTVGRVAQLHNRYIGEFPKSAANAFLTDTLPRVGFQTLPIAKLMKVAAEVGGRTDEELNASYVAACQRYGLDGRDVASMRARAFIRAQIENGAGHAMSAAEASLEQAAGNIAHGNPSLAVLQRTAQAMGWDDDAADAADDTDLTEDDLPPVTEEVTEEVTVESPLTGEELVLELGTAEGEVEGPEEPIDEGEFALVGQLEDFETDTDPMPLEEEVVETIPDPSTDGEEMLEVVLRPADAPESPDGFGLEAHRVYAMKDGRPAKRPLLTAHVPSIAHVLSLMASRLAAPRAQVGMDAEGRRALVRFASGDVMLVRAESEVFDPKVNEQVVTQQVEVPDDGGETIKSDGFSEKAPKGGPAYGGNVAGLRLSPEDVRTVCASIGLDAAAVLDRVLEGEDVSAGPRGASHTLSADDYGRVTLTRPDGRTKQGSVDDLDGLVGQFMTHVAYELSRTAERPEVEIRPLFAMRCGHCRQATEYVMPDEQTPVTCGGCGRVASVDEVETAFYTRQASTTGYVITTTVPTGGNPRALQVNADRLVHAVRSVVPNTEGALLPDARLEMVVHGASDAHIAHIERMLSDRFGAKAEAAPAAAPAGPAAPEPAATPTAGIFRVAWSDAASGQTGLLDVEARNAEQAEQLARGGLWPGVQVQAQVTIPEPDPTFGADEPGGDALPPAPEMGGGVTGEAREAVEAAFTHYRATGKGLVEAVGEFRSQYGGFLEQYGREETPRRHLAEADIVEIAEGVYSKPSMLVEAARPTESEFAQAKRMRVAHLKAAQGLNSDPAVNEQQPAAVSAPDDASNMLGEDSTAGHGGGEMNPSISGPQTGSQAAGEGANSDTGFPSETEQRDPGTFGAKWPPPADGSYDPGAQQGTSFPDTDMGQDSSTGDNPTTKKWDSASSGAKPQ